MLVSKYDMSHMLCVYRFFLRIDDQQMPVPRAEAARHQTQCLFRVSQGSLANGFSSEISSISPHFSAWLALMRLPLKAIHTNR